jgi:UDP-N-acetylglucosamine:LPS N-acetylglucosamine transferase
MKGTCRPSSAVGYVGIPHVDVQSMTKAPKILIISSDTGGGHRSAAAAIVAGVQKFFNGDSYTVRVVRAVEESHQITRRGVALYNWLLRNRQHWMKYLYWMINRFRPETREFFHRRCIGYVHEIFERWCPHVVVSVHPLTQHIFARVLKDLRLADRIPLVTVVTDPCYGFWKGWACDDVRLYLVASEEAKRQLVDYGVAPERIKVAGMPIHPKFHHANTVEVEIARRELGLAPDKFTVFINAGFVGGGNIPHIFRELVRGDLPMQAIFLAGHNEELKLEAEQLAAVANFPVKVIGYSDEVERLMRAADVMISKLGGLSTYEAMASRVPVIADVITPPMPQEAGAGEMLAGRGAGVLLRKATDIVPELRKMIEDSKYYQTMRNQTASIALPDSTRFIVEEITSLIPAGIVRDRDRKVIDIRTA